MDFFNNIKDFNEQYETERQSHRIKNSKVGCLLAIALVPFGITLDWNVYPNITILFLGLRLITAAIITAIYIAHFSPSLKKRSAILTLSWPIIIQIMICIMIFITDGATSTYYAGLNLVILAVGVLLPLSVYESIFLCLFSMILYILACISHPMGLSDFPIFFNNFYFIFLTSIIAVISNYFANLWSQSQFNLRCEIEDKRNELQIAISDLKNTQAQLVHSEKINGLGQMSAGLLHEINNPLNFSFQGIQLLLEDKNIKDDRELKDIATDVLSGLDRINTVISDLHSFTHPSDSISRAEVVLNNVVDQALRFTASRTKNIHIDKQGEFDIIFMGSHSNIVQVIVNLISNAADALEEHSNPLIVIKSEAANQKLLIEIKDNGPGVPDNNLANIFDPFFTTKEVGKGTGLGLSICSTIIQNHGGQLSVRRDDNWTVFFFNLLIVD